MRDWPCVDTHLPCAVIAHHVWSTGFPCKMALCVEQSHPVRISTYPMWSLIILCSHHSSDAVTDSSMWWMITMCTLWTACVQCRGCKVCDIMYCHNHSCSTIDEVLHYAFNYKADQWLHTTHTWWILPTPDVLLSRLMIGNYTGWLVFIDNTW